MPKRDELLSSINNEQRHRPTIQRGPEFHLSTQPKQTDDGHKRSALGHAIRDDLKRALKQAAAAQGRYAYELTEEAILEYFHNHGLKRYLES
jgi:hypothetical protein